MRAFALKGHLEADDTLADLLDEPAPKKRRGRPPGSRNKAAPAEQPAAPAPPPDVDALLNEQLRHIAAAQQQLGRESVQGFSAMGLKQLASISAALVRAVEALGRAAKVKQELADRMSPQELLEAAIQKIEQQPITTINAVLRRLSRVRNGKVGGFTPAPLVQATEAIASLQERQ